MDGGRMIRAIHALPLSWGDSWISFGVCWGKVVFCPSTLRKRRGEGLVSIVPALTSFKIHEVEGCTTWTAGEAMLRGDAMHALRSG